MQTLFVLLFVVEIIVTSLNKKFAYLMNSFKINLDDIKQRYVKMCARFETFYNLCKLNLTHQINDDDIYIPRIEEHKHSV